MLRLSCSILAVTAAFALAAPLGRALAAPAEPASAAAGSEADSKPAPSGLPAPKPWLESKIRAAKALADRRVKPDTPAAEAWKRDAQALIDGMVDWKAMISRSLGSKWDDLSDAERDRFYNLMRDLIRASFESKLKLALEEEGQNPGQVKIEWLEEEVEADEATLLARVTAERRRVDLEFDLNRHGDAWKLADLTIDGAGTVRLYRSSFRQVLRDEGWDGLIARLEQKLEDVKSGRADFMPGNDARSGN